jgi:hypothetical protein
MKIERISNWIVNISKGWLVMVGLLIMLLFVIFVLPEQASRSVEISGTSSSPDTSFFYTASDLYQSAEDFGKPGRQAYIRSRWTFDLIFPMVYVLFLTTGISWLFKAINTHDKRWGLTNLLPLLGGLFDYLENVATSTVMAIYPERINILMQTASAFSMLKWIMISLSFLAYLILILWAVKSRLFNRG